MAHSYTVRTGPATRMRCRVPRLAVTIASVLLLQHGWIGASRSLAQTTAAPPLPKGITPAAKNAIDRGLSYLARSQSRDGSWSNRGRYGDYPVAMTGLVGLAMLMDGNTTTQGRYAPNVDRAAKFLMRSATPRGLIARAGSEARPMYGHGFSMLFLSQLYGMTADVDTAKRLHRILSKGVDLIGRAQSNDGGWYYTPDSNADEGSVTITQVQALRSCRNVGVAVPKRVIDAAMKYLVRSQNSDGGIRYALRQARGNSRPAITAAAVCCWYNGGDYNSVNARRALAFSKSKIKPRNTQGGHDFYAHLYLAQALYISKDKDWEKYFVGRRDHLLALQQPDGSWRGDGVGDAYGTSVALIVLQLPFNQLPIMQQ